jgi:hypothetical protein
MAFIGDFVVDHPIISVGSLAIGGSLGYGVTHKFLDFSESYAIGAGVVAGVSSVVAEAYIVSLIPSVKEILDGTVAATAELTAPVATAATSIVQGGGNTIADAGKAVGSDTLVEVGGFFGAETATFDSSGAQTGGNHELDTPEEKAAFWRWITSRTEEDRKLFEAAVASAHRQEIGLQADSGADATFPTNKENPPQPSISTAVATYTEEAKEDAQDIVQEMADAAPANSWAKGMLEALANRNSY